MRLTTRALVLSGLFIALGFILPFFTMQVPAIGGMLLPMHIPVLICGFLCGAPYGLIVGFITPLLRSTIMGMPPMYPTAMAMAFELAAYGFLAGILYQKFPKKTGYIYLDLILAMIAGRVVWGIVSFLLYGIKGNAFTLGIFLNSAVINAIPGIIVQLVLIPPLIIALQRANLRLEG
ncbi:MAG: ECF transporter S component [Clostridia bacterium]|jgi:riboflavin transporter FmnP|nr:ECF transporter S component [Clostridia bacterium]